MQGVIFEQRFGLALCVPVLFLPDLAVTHAVLVYRVQILHQIDRLAVLVDDRHMIDHARGALAIFRALEVEPGSDQDVRGVLALDDLQGSAAKALHILLAGLLARQRVGRVDDLVDGLAVEPAADGHTGRGQ